MIKFCNQWLQNLTENLAKHLPSFEAIEERLQALGEILDGNKGEYPS